METLALMDKGLGEWMSYLNISIPWIIQSCHIPQTQDFRSYERPRKHLHSLRTLVLEDPSLVVFYLS